MGAKGKLRRYVPSHSMRSMPIGKKVYMRADDGCFNEKSFFMDLDAEIIYSKAVMEYMDLPYVTVERVGGTLDQSSYVLDIRADPSFSWRRYQFIHVNEDFGQEAIGRAYLEFDYPEFQNHEYIEYSTEQDILDENPELAEMDFGDNNSNVDVVVYAYSDTEFNNLVSELPELLHMTEDDFFAYSEVDLQSALNDSVRKQDFSRASKIIKEAARRGLKLTSPDQLSG